MKGIPYEIEAIIGKFDDVEEDLAYAAQRCKDEHAKVALELSATYAKDAVRLLEEAFQMETGRPSLAEKAKEVAEVVELETY